MIAEIKGLPNNVAAFRVTGHVTKKNYDDVILPVVANVKSHHPHFNFLMVIETDIKNYTIGAWADDFLMSLINITRFHRMAETKEFRLVPSHGLQVEREMLDSLLDGHLILRMHEVEILLSNDFFCG